MKGLWAAALMAAVLSLVGATAAFAGEPAAAQSDNLTSPLQEHQSILMQKALAMKASGAIAADAKVGKVAKGQYVKLAQEGHSNIFVILAEFGAPVPARATWLETAEPRDVPPGFAGLVLKGREAGGMCGAADGLTLLALCPDKGRVILDAGLGPRV